MELISEFLFKEVGLVGGLSLAANLFILVQWVRGELVSRKHVDQVQKMGDTFERAWENSNSNQSRIADALSKVETLTEVFTHFIDSLPKNRGVDK